MLIITGEFQTRELQSSTMMSSREFPRKYKNSLKKKEVRELSSRELPCKLNPAIRALLVFVKLSVFTHQHLLFSSEFSGVHHQNSHLLKLLGS